MNNQRIKDHFSDDKEFKELLREAESGAEGDFEEKFIDDMWTSYHEWGMDAFMSEAVYETLIKIGA